MSGFGRILREIQLEEIAGMETTERTEMAKSAVVQDRRSPKGRMTDRMAELMSVLLLAAYGEIPPRIS